jgi:hypothetical protein
MSKLSPLQGTPFYSEKISPDIGPTISFEPPERLKDLSPTLNLSPPRETLFSAFVDGEAFASTTATINEEKAQEEISESLKKGTVTGFDGALSLLLGAPLMNFLQGEDSIIK